MTKFTPIDDYYSLIGSIVDDQLISDRMMSLSVEFVSIEASQDVHTYTSLAFNFPADGGITSTIVVYTMRLNMYSTTGDFIRLAFEILYVLFLAYNMYLFI